MDCSLVENDLIPFHFGLCDEVSRTRTEAHLSECGKCLGAFLNLKRNIEMPAQLPLPPARLKARLKNEVARTFLEPKLRKNPRASTPYFLGRIAISASLGLGLAIFILSSHFVGVTPPPKPVLSSASLQSLDTARPVAQSLNYF
jgi:predicted anti-sigma-YlaC factor YlaD